MEPWARYYEFGSWEGRYRWTLQAMERLAEHGGRDPVIRQWAVEQVQGCRPRGKACEVARIFEAVRNRIRFVRDPHEVEWLQTPQYLHEKKAGDCDCISVYLASCLKALGYQTRFQTGKLGAAPRPGHVWTEVNLEGQWIPLDASWVGKIGSLAPWIQKNGDRYPAGLDDSGLGFWQFLAQIGAAIASSLITRGGKGGPKSVDYIRRPVSSPQVPIAATPAAAFPWGPAALVLIGFVALGLLLK